MRSSQEGRLLRVGVGDEVVVAQRLAFLVAEVVDNVSLERLLKIKTIFIGKLIIICCVTQDILVVIYVLIR